MSKSVAHFLLERLIALESFLARDRTNPEVLSLVELRQRLLATSRVLANHNGAGLAGD